MSQITHLLLAAIAANLKLECQTRIASSDPTRASLVKLNRFQDSPLENNVYIAVCGGDPKNPDFRDARVRANEMESAGIYFPPGEVGGGHLWWRRGRVILGVYYLTQKFAEDTASDYAHKVLGRVIHFTERTRVTDLADEFGEQALLLQVLASSFFEGGGPDTQYIWRGEVIWQALTARPL